MERNPTKKCQEVDPKSKKTEEQVSKSDQSYWEMMIDGIVRPPRAKYQTNQLGGKFFTYHGKAYYREEHQIMMEGKKIQLTLYLAENRSKYIILYMHGNSSCKIQALGLIRHIPQKVSLASFDFMGCGRNQQTDTISLGYREAQQAETICKFLEDKGYKVILWGRSMGAATALLYGKAQFIIADSSYKSFKSLCKQVAKQYSPSAVPNFMVTCFFPCVFGKLRKDVDKKAKYDVEELDVREAVKRLDPKTTIVFMTGQNDNLIHPRNSQKLWKCCPCEKKYLKVFKGDHNSKRPDEVMIEVMKLIQNYINESTKNELKISPQEIQLNLGKQ